MGRLQGLSAIVTGAGSGIGRASALKIAAEGSSVLIADLNPANAENVAAEIRQNGGAALAMKCDIRSEDEIAAAVARCLSEFGKLDALHNNAALLDPAVLMRDGGIADMDAEIWDAVFQTNVRGTMLFAKHALKAMLSGKGGAIVNTASINGLAADSYLSAYGSSKAAVISLTQHIATAYGKHGIRCNAVAPSLILTEGVRTNMGPLIDVHVEQTLTPALGTPEQVADLVAFLLSAEASYINGATVPVDGGTMAHVPTLIGGNMIRNSN